MNDKIIISTDRHFLLYFYITSIIYHNAAEIYLTATTGVRKCYFSLLSGVLILSIFISLNDVRILSCSQLNSLHLKPDENVCCFKKYAKVMHKNLKKNTGRMNPSRPPIFILFSVLKISWRYNRLFFSLNSLS